MFFGTKVSEKTAFRLMDTYHDRQGNFLDTANVYYAFFDETQGGESEETIGTWLKSRSLRSKMVIATKVGVAMDGVPPGLNPDIVIQECEKSLKRLQTDYIDIYYLHVDDRNTPLDIILEAFFRLQDGGKIRYIGASNFSAWRLSEAKSVMEKIGENEDFACVQCWYTYLQPNYETVSESGRYFISEELKDYCENHNLPILGYETLLRGVYSNPEKKLREQFVSVDNTTRLELVRIIAEKNNITPAQVVYGWMLRQRPKPIPIITASKESQISENMDSVDVKLPERDFEQLEAALRWGAQAVDGISFDKK
jgi:aryl-alcohol dehydrogenase-like predicted oxidoreductase